MTLNAFNPLFQVLAALIIFVTGFFALFLSMVIAAMLARLGYVGGAWAVSKSMTTYAQRRQNLVDRPARRNATPMAAWRDRVAEALLTPRSR